MTILTADKPITMGGTEYALDGSFRTLKAIQTAFDDDILQLLFRVGSMRFDELASLILVGISQSPNLPARDVVEQAVVDDIGILETRDLLAEWLVLATTPKRDRPKKAEEIAEARRRISELSDSLGGNTGSSA